MWGIFEPYVPNNPPCPLCGQQYDQYGYCRCDPIALAPDFTKGVIPSAVVDPNLLYGGDARSKQKKGDYREKAQACQAVHLRRLAGNARRPARKIALESEPASRWRL